MNTQYKEKGFTIIEVVLVLAIAGLIFLMVFIALPALQRNQRDTARKGDVGSVVSAVSSFSSNNKGTFPGNTNATVTFTGTNNTAGFGSYLNERSSNTTSVVVSQVAVPLAGTTVTSGDGVITVTKASKCGTSATGSQGISQGTSRQFTAVTKLESGGGVYFCQEG
jgi:type IV pilus assembly protein PilA